MLKNYFKIAYRNLLRQKGFSFINVAGLSLGLTACLLIALFVWDERQFDKFIPEGEQVFRIYTETKSDEGVENMAFTSPRFAPTLQQQFPEVEEVLRVLHIQSTNLFEAGGKKMYEAGGINADPSFFNVFPLSFVYGSPKDALADPTSIVISKEMAERFFGNENPVGKEILYNQTPYQVKGVVENNPKFHLSINHITNLASREFPEERMQSWRWQQLSNYVKLKKNADVQALEAKLQKLVAEELRTIKEANFTYQPFLQPLHNIHLYSADFKYDMAVRGNITYVRGLSIIAIFILVIACFNFVNLETAKSMQRAKEVGVRKTIGASRSQLMLQFIAETVLLTFISILIAVALTALFLPQLNEFAEKNISFSVFGNPLNMLTLLGLVLVLGVLAGFYPALVLSGFKPVKVLKGAAVSNTSPGKIPWLRHSLVVLQFALSVLLIISALVVFRQVEYLNNKDLGFDKEQIMFFPMRGENMTENYETFKNELLKSPGVSSVSIGYGFPGDLVAGDGIFVQRNGEKKEYGVTQLMVDYDYLFTLGVELVAGRNFSKDISTDANEGFIINETAVKELGFGSPEKALGQPLLWDVWVSEPAADSLKRGKIIGVVKDFHYKSLYDKMEPAVLQIFPPANWKVAVKMETAGVRDAMAHVKSVWSQFSPDFPIEYSFLDDSFDQMYKAEGKLKSLLWIFTGMAIFVGCLGLFGLAAYAAERRTKEIGIRKVLGATKKSIVLLLSKDFVKLVLIAILVASPIAWYFMNDWLKDFAYRIEISWWIFALAGVSAVAIALVTVSVHAIKAALRNPVRNLRTE